MLNAVEGLLNVGKKLSDVPSGIYFGRPFLNEPSKLFAGAILTSKPRLCGRDEWLKMGVKLLEDDPFHHFTNYGKKGDRSIVVWIRLLSSFKNWHN